MAGAALTQVASTAGTREFTGSENVWIECAAPGPERGSVRELVQPFNARETTQTEDDSTARRAERMEASNEIQRSSAGTKWGKECPVLFRNLSIAVLNQRELPQRSRYC